MGLVDGMRGTIEAYRQALFETSETVSELSRRQRSLQNNLDRFNSSSETAAKIARKLVDVNARLNDELREQADLIRRVSGVNVTELEASKGRQSIQTRQNAEAFRLKQLSEQEAVYQAIAKLNERDGTALQEKLNIQRNVTNQATLEAQRRREIEERASTGLSRRIPTPYRTAGSMGFPVALPEIEQDRRIRAREEAKQSAERALNLQKSNSLLTQGVTGLKAQVAIAEQLGGVYAEIVRSLERANDRQSQLFRARANRAQRQELGGENLQRLERINKLATNNVLQEKLKNKVALAGNAIKKNEFTVAKQIGREIDQLLEAEDQRIDRARRVLRFRQREREETRAIAKERAKSRKEAFGSAIIGGAFPLLFGQGAGAAVGGGLGGAAGGLMGGQFGFGLSLVGTALGTAADTFAKNMASLASSLSKPTEALQALEDAGLKVDEATSKQVESLMEAGRAYEAQQLVLGQINDKLGPTAVAQLVAYDQETKELEQRYQEATAALTKELLPAMLGFITLINNLAGAFNNMPDWMVKFIKGATSSGPFSVARFPLETLQNIGRDRANPSSVLSAVEGLQIPTPEVDPKFKEREDKLKEAEDKRKVDLEAQNQELQAQLNLLNSGLDLTTDKGLALAKEVVVAKYLGELEKIRTSDLKDGEKALRERQALLKQNLAIARLEQQQRTAQERAAQQAAREAEAMQRQLQSADIAQLNAQKERFAFDVKLAEFEGGKEAALRKRLEQLTEERNAEIVILNIQANQRINNAKSFQEAQALIETAAAKRDLLIEQYKLERDMTVQAQERLVLERELAKLAGKRETEDIGIGLRRQIGAVERRISSPFGDQDSEMLELRIKQTQRLEDATRALDRQIEDVDMRLKKDPGNEDLQQDLRLLEARKLKYEELLPVLDQVEQKELQMQQTLQQLQPLTNALSQGLTDLFTGLVDGSKDAQEVFADMLKNMGQALIQQGAVMIAQYIAIGIARMFAGLGGGNRVGPENFNLEGFGSLPSMPFKLFAEGGYVTRPTNALIGEGSEPEYVLPASKMPEALERYSAGVRGSAVIPSNGDSGGMTGASGGGGTIVNYNGPTLNFNSEDYVPASAVPGIIDEATKRGAKAGEARTFATLRNSRSQRGRIGLGR